MLLVSTWKEEADVLWSGGQLLARSDISPFAKVMEAGTSMDAAQRVLTRLNLVDNTSASNREATRYLRDLARSSLDMIEQQPAQQQTSALSLEHQLSELCVRNTPTFVLTQEAINRIPRVCAFGDVQLTSLTTSHKSRIQSATEAFERQANITLSARKSIVAMKDTMETSLLHLIQLPQIVSKYVLSADYEEAVQLVQHFFAILPPKESTTDKVIQALLEEMKSVLVRANNVLMNSLRDPQIELRESRAWASYLLRLQAITHTHYPDTEADQETADICFGFLHARFLRIHMCLDSNNDILDAIETWKDVVLNACTTAISIFVDNRVNPEKPVDIISAQLISMFATHAIDVLFARLSQYLYKLTRAPTGPVIVWEDISRRMRAIHTKLCFASESLAAVGIQLELSLVPYAGVSESHLNAFDHAALSLWVAALHAIQPEEVSVAAPEKESMNAMPLTLASSPLCVGLGRHVVAALNVLRHFAPLHIQRYVVDAMGKRFARILSTLPSDAQDCFIHALAPWASTALVQGVFDQPPQSYSLLNCTDWQQACEDVKRTALSQA